MKRGEKPEGYRQMRPKTFPASNYPGSSRQMLQEIRESLRNLSKPSDAAKAEHDLNKMSTEDPRQVRNPPKFGTHHKALQEIRNSLLPFANETSSSRSPSEVNPQMFQDLQAAGFDEVSLCSPVCPGTRFVDHGDLELTQIRLPLLPKYWD